MAMTRKNIRLHTANGLYEEDIFDVLSTYARLYFIYVIESSLIVSNYSVRETNEQISLGNFPLWNLSFFGNETDGRFSHILDFDTLRLGRKVIENNKNTGSFEFGIILITEIGNFKLTIFYFFGGKILIPLFIENPTADALSSAAMFLKIVSPFYFVVSAKLTADGILRGAGLMKEFMIATFTDLILRVGMAFLLSKTALGSTGIWCAWPVGWTVSAVISLAFYLVRIHKKS